MFSALALALLATLLPPTTAQTPPNFNLTSTTNLPFSFLKNPISAGQPLPLSASRSAPIVSLPATLPQNATYLLTMVDPDAPSPLAPGPQSEILHWLQPSVRASGFNRTLLPTMDAVAPYMPPMPPSVEPHRYTLLLFAQKGDTFEVPAGFERFGPSVRSAFDALAFSRAAGLGEPVAASYFLSGLGNGTANGTGGAGGAGGGNTTAGGQGPVATGGVGRNEVGWAVMVGGLAVLGVLGL
ncbi:MAG: hypothetical protein MMC23_005690 [Stictis urceolatum]|nr:hypothetical protein [Stictis urceolata]